MSAAVEVEPNLPKYEDMDNNTETQTGDEPTETSVREAVEELMTDALAELDSGRDPQELIDAATWGVEVARGFQDQLLEHLRGPDGLAH